ncbi:MAG: TolC family protein [Alcanivoracaceae bacterium]
MKAGLVAGVVTCSLFWLSACTSTKPVSTEQLVEQGARHWTVLQQDYELVAQPLSLERALALGIERNVDFRLRAFDAALATSNTTLASMSMLPSLTASAGYTYRDRTAGSFSESVSTGQVSLEPSTSLDSRRLNTSLEMSWNLLDFGVAWYRTRALADQAHIAEEQRVRMLHNVTREIVFAWDMARAYQQYHDEMLEARELIRQAMERTDQLESLRLRDPVLVLDYRRALLLFRQQLNRLLVEMEVAEDELSRLLNLPAGYRFAIDEQDDLLSALPMPEASLQAWQLMGLINRPEVRAAFYEQRAADRSAAEKMLQALPAAAFRYGIQTDSNSYMLNNRWQEGGAQLSWNLVQLAAYPARRRQARLDKQRAAAAAEMQMTAVLSQVIIAGKQLDVNRENACLAQSLRELEARRLGILVTRQEQAALDRLTVIRARLDHLLLSLEAEMYRAEYRRALLALLASAGLGVTPDVLEANDDDMAAAIRDWITDGLGDRFRLLYEEVKTSFDLAEDDAPAVMSSPACS